MTHPMSARVFTGDADGFISSRSTLPMKHISVTLSPLTHHVFALAHATSSVNLITYLSTSTSIRTVHF